MSLRAKLPFWLLFSLPAILLTIGSLRGSSPPAEMLHPTGEMSIRLMILAMLPGPLTEFFGPSRFLRGWIALRRNLGVIAYIYAFLHLLFYVADAGSYSAILGEFLLASIWTGWIGLALMTIPAAISFDAALRSLGRRWKQLQRLVYGALVFSAVHWVLLEWHWVPALVHVLPIIVAWSLRALARKGIHLRTSP